MAEVGFYHLTATPLERALPRLLEQALAQGHRVVVMAGSDERVLALDALLWSYSDASFLPHGTARDGNAPRQPVFLTAGDDNPNAATMLVLVDGAACAHLADFKRVCDMFDGNDPAAVAAARERWRAAKEAGHALTYLQQTGTGWEKRAGG
jgi:DNA polymerase III subunit chi